MDKELYVDDENVEKNEATMKLEEIVTEEKELIIEEIINGISSTDLEVNEVITEGIGDEISEEIYETPEEIYEMPIIIPSDLEVPAEKIAKSKQRADIERLYNKKPIKKKKMNFSWIVLTIIFMLIAYFAVNTILMNREIYTRISIDINPSVEIEINKQNKVINMIALNADAKNAIGNYNYKNKKIENVLEEVFLLLSDRIYINAENDIMLLSINSQAAKRAETVKELAFNTIIKVFSNKSIKPRVIRQSFVIDENIKREAELYKISTGKVQFLNMMIEQSPYAISYLAKLPLEELFEIMDEDKIDFTAEFERSLYADQVNKIEGNSTKTPIDEVIPEEDEAEIEPKKEEVKNETPKEIPKKEEVKKDTTENTTEETKPNTETPKEEVKKETIEEIKPETQPKQEEMQNKPEIETPAETQKPDEIINV